MSSANTRIAEIVDQTAAIAAGVAGVRVVFGCGSGLVNDPLRMGEKIAAGFGDPGEPFTHVSDLPTSSSMALGMYGEDILTSIVPMRLFIDIGPGIDVVRSSLIAMYPLYLAALALTLTLNGTCQRWSTLTYRLGHNEQWAWLEMALTVHERLVLTKHA